MKNPEKFYEALESDCTPVVPKSAGDSVADLVAGMEKRLAEKIDAANAEFTKKIEDVKTVETPSDNTPVDTTENENESNENTEVNEND